MNIRHVIAVVGALAMFLGCTFPVSAGICPFDNGGSTGDVDPFAGDPTPSGLPCPFDGGGSTGDVDPFAGDGTASGSPCPVTANATDGFNALYGAATADTIPLRAFPVNSSEAEPAGIQCGGTDCPLPTDPDGDGLYEDLNGNGMLDFDDLAVLFKYLEWIPGNEPVSLFDFNGNGMMDFDDIVVLFKEI